MKTLGEQAKEFRESKGWNSTQMANAVGTSRQNIESLEGAGNRIPKYLGDLAKAMGRSVDDMLVMAGLASKARRGATVAEHGLSAEEEAVLTAYRTAPPAVQAAILLAAQAISGDEALDNDLKREANARLAASKKIAGVRKRL